MRETSPCEFTPCELGVCCLHLYLFLADTRSHLAHLGLRPADRHLICVVPNGSHCHVPQRSSQAMSSLRIFGCKLIRSPTLRDKVR